MRAVRLPTLALLAACGGETGFQQTPGQNTTTEANGQMEVYPSELTWTDLEVGILSREYLKITSTGDETLRIYDISVVSSASGQFTMEEVEEFEVEPGLEREFTVACTLAADLPAQGELRIRSNDPDQIDLRLSLYATPLGYTGTGETGDTGDTGQGS
ncbi:hypothetical protein EDM68_03660 [Candidatus Uhrbacteria bacterium]|nr:MAG: hypothetical protein EDM68_03660 [Candidatus Uhrbacteria bacterium]